MLLIFIRWSDSKQTLERALKLLFEMTHSYWPHAFVEYFNTGYSLEQSAKQS